LKDKRSIIILLMKLEEKHFWTTKYCFTFN
jgi:hypothetical protein